MEVSVLALRDLGSARPGRRGRAEAAQKENIFDRSRMAPKTPIKNEPIDLSKQKGCTPERNPITPVKIIDKPQADPWTPTANLKMLVSAASPDMRDREKKKELFRPIENSEQSDTPDSLQYDIVDDSTVEEFEKRRPSRKQKSLGLLCQKFLARYPNYPLSTEKTTISLDEVASILGVERRRIYDIVNVLESLHLVSRVAKNQYCWHGRHNLSQTLKKLQEAGELQYGELMTFQHKEQDSDYKFGERKRETVPESQDRPLLDFSEPDCSSASANSRKDKSLRIMSQKFVMLFLVSKTKIVTLDIAAKILIEETQDTVDHSKFKSKLANERRINQTFKIKYLDFSLKILPPVSGGLRSIAGQHMAKVRRLYDIANVLTSLDLIKKVHVTEERGRKPAFKWIGPVEFSGKTDELTGHSQTSDPLPETQREACAQYQICATGKQRLTRHASFNGAQPCEGTRRKVSSEPNSPRQEKQANIVNSDEYCSKMVNLAAVCRQKIEEDTRNKACGTETILNSARNSSVTSPFSLLPVPGDSDFCVNPLPQTAFPVVQAEVPNFSLPAGINSQVPHPSTPAASKTEDGKPALVPSQPFLCFPSSSLFMLCGGLQENNLSETQPTAGDKGNWSAEAQAAVPPALCQKRSSYKCTLPSPPVDDEEPVAKKQNMEQTDLPLSLVVPKKPCESPKTESTPGSDCPSAVHLETYLDLESPTAPEAGSKESTKPLDCQEQEKRPQNKDPDEPPPGNEHIPKENASQPFQPQYLYVQPPAGLSSFNFLFSANQAPGAISLPSNQLPSLSVPCVMVPSSALASFPLVCSPSFTSPLSHDGSFPAAASMSFSMSSLASTTPVFISTTAVVTPKVSPTPSVDPSQPAHPALHLSPVLTRSCGAVKLDSPVCVGHPVTLLKLQQPSSAPLTPKSIRPAHHEAFFKTPGSLGDPVTWKKNEGNQTRNASSVQRRLEISGTSAD
ncbi:Transcription factor E2F7 [Willisornis vidua]|uniref:Transcription factor E2F7 n=1 Tax=Willisornis vidua TaxID=1566151 RepID=A0ABQ9CMW6_9PASS|nr:Transcription factor E2F7 [Willisornis vidua]